MAASSFVSGTTESTAGFGISAQTRLMGISVQIFADRGDTHYSPQGLYAQLAFILRAMADCTAPLLLASFISITAMDELAPALTARCRQRRRFLESEMNGVLPV